MTAEPGLSSTAPPPRRRLVIHAGLGKSGSSAIQKYCRENSAALRDHGAAYLGMFLERGAASPHDFASSAALEDALSRDAAIEDRLVSLLQEKIEARPGVQTFIWSQIALARHAGVVGRVVERLRPVCDAEVILYFRHQASWLVSAYLQWGVKHKTYPGPLRAFAEWLPLAEARGGGYRAVIEAWLRAIGAERLHLRSYDQTPDVVADFLAVTGLGSVPQGGDATRHYETPDPALMTLFRLYQGQADGEALPDPLQRALSDNKVATRRYRDVDPRSTLPRGAEWSRFVASFADTNAALANDFGLQLVPPQTGPAPDAVTPAPAAAIAPLLDLIIAMNRRIGVLERRLKRQEDAHDAD
ncbi:hypothetical protein F1C10_02910 [Sphingomonas sp. NBWT7]|uniref:hypothetical protein n=1 Tax=Sphingomonas sp. NBWT7 TaxID=2596913 RepID=UPI0016244734|nr:hypothetical protein [Sphingomonas sp. NBWT7]QNE31008.1 hypothetical protein F1C10_02910 [Sphingomonas sp. NBWT7]